MLVKLFLLLVLPLALAQRCRDDPNFTWDYEWNGETLTHHCSFLTNSNNAEQNKKRQDNWCDERVGRNNVLIKSRCKESCGKCEDDDQNDPTCEDNPKFTWDYEWKGETLTHHCSFLTNSNNAEQNKKRQDNWCDERVGRNKVLIKYECPKSCGNCDDNQDDTCTDKPSNWKDSQGKGCTWYENGDIDRCARYGDKRKMDGKVANDVCCVCGGGKSEDDFCDDFPNWSEGGNGKYDCEWYEEKPSRCRQYGNSNPWRGRTANEACCVCKNRFDDNKVAAVA